jgi:hypothetical protein
MMNRKERGVRPDGMKETTGRSARRHGFPNGIRNQFLPKAEQKHSTLNPPPLPRPLLIPLNSI